MSEQEIPAIEDLEVLARLWYNNHADQLGDTISPVRNISIKHKEHKPINSRRSPRSNGK